MIFWILHRVVVKCSDVSEERTAYTLKMGAIRSSEKSEHSTTQSAEIQKEAIIDQHQP
jgi:hypothetical protein